MQEGAIRANWKEAPRASEAGSWRRGTSIRPTLSSSGKLYFAPQVAGALASCSLRFSGYLTSKILLSSPV